MKRMRYFAFAIVLLLGSKLCALDITDHNAINQVVHSFTHSWNHNQGKGFAAFYSDDADFVNIFGMAFTGKEEIEKRHIEILTTFLKGSVFEVTNVKVRQVASGVVVAHVSWRVTNVPNPQGTGPKELEGIFTHTIVKNEGEWKITSSQNTLSSKGRM